MIRTPLSTQPTPAGAERSIVTLRHTLADGRKIKLTYLPDRFITTPDAFTALADAAADASTLEALAAAVTESFYDALVPFWLRVNVKTPEKHHSAVLMRLQPGFKLPEEYQSLLND